MEQDVVSPEKKDMIDRLSKIEGQIRGIKKMMIDERDCFDVLKQIGAAGGALRSLQKNILEHRVHACIEQALETEGRREELVRELVRHLGDFRF